MALRLRASWPRLNTVNAFSADAGSFSLRSTAAFSASGPWSSGSLMSVRRSNMAAGYRSPGLVAQPGGFQGALGAGVQVIPGAQRRGDGLGLVRAAQGLQVQ